jgi:CRISPR system Cascade subunit CasD
MANTLFLKLEGPMQSWGERSRWSERDSAAEPTKSGVVGLLGCALGWADDDDLRGLSQAIRLGVRIDRPGEVMIDYHTIVGGVMSAEGKVKRNATTKQAETVVTRRTYLVDAVFLAAIQSTPEWIARLAAAVQVPCWPIFLGRKSCPPTRPVYAGEGDFEDLETALREAPIGRPADVLRAVIEMPAGEGVRRRDELESRRLRTYLPRYTRELLIQPVGKDGA